MEQQPAITKNSLTRALQRDLNFVHTKDNAYLVNDGLESVGSIYEYECLPAIARVPRTGRRFELGVRRVDLEGLIELAKLIKSGVRGVDHIISFWEGNPNVKVSDEDDVIFIGKKISPTKRGFEEEYSSVRSTYDMAIAGALEGKSYVEMLQHEWFGSFVKGAESFHKGSGVSVIFPEKERSLISCSGDACEIPVKVTVDTLREYPIARSFGLSAVPGKITQEGKTREFKNGSWIVEQQGSKAIQISIPSTFRRIIRIDEEQPNDRLTLYLQIPEGVGINSIEDIQQLKQAVVLTGDNFKRLGVDVKVADDSFEINALDDSLKLEFRKPVCPECKIPKWKFPDRYDLTTNRDKSPKDWGDYAHLYDWGIGGGEPPKFYPNLGEDKGDKQEDYCGDCIIPVVQRYIDEHAYASRAKAVEFMRQNLDMQGYKDVDINPDSVFNLGARWHAFTQIEYARDGRKITRYTGSLGLTHDGEVTSGDNDMLQTGMLPLEYVKFRYKVNPPLYPPQFKDIIKIMLDSGGMTQKEADAYTANYEYLEQNINKLGNWCKGNWVASVNGVLFVSSSISKVQELIKNEPNSNRAYIEHIPY